MDFKLTDEQELMLENLREFCDRWVDEERIQKWYDERRVDPETCKAYLEAGFGYMFIPEEYGGIPSDAQTLALVVEELMRCTGATMPFMSYGLAMYDLATFGTPEQVEKGMKSYQETGQQCFSLALSEPGAGSDNRSMTATIHWDDENGTAVLNGTKTMVSHAETAPYIMFIGKDEDPSHDNKSMSMLLVEKDTPGITMAPLHKIGQTSTNFDEVYFDNVVVPQSTLLGEKGKGFLQLMENFEIERIMLSAHSLGLAQAALEEATRYAAQLIAEKLTDMRSSARTCATCSTRRRGSSTTAFPCVLTARCANVTCPPRRRRWPPRPCRSSAASVTPPRARSAASGSTLAAIRSPVAPRRSWCTSPGARL